MILELIEGAVLLGMFIYHRWQDSKKITPPGTVWRIPLADEGATVPLTFGRCRVRAPILAWCGNEDVLPEYGGTGNPDMYLLDMFFMLGIPFTDGFAQLHTIWMGDVPLTTTSDLSTLVGNGGHETPIFAIAITNDPRQSGGYVEFLNGNTSQQLVDPATPSTSTTRAGDRWLNLTGDGTKLPGFRGYACVMLTGSEDFGGNPRSWAIGTDLQPPAYSFELSTYPATSLVPGFLGGTIGVEANPADVIRELLIGVLGKLGIDAALIDDVTFAAVAQALKDEGHGYSISIEDAKDAAEHINDVLRQIDGVLYEDPTDGLIKLKLIRGDYDPAACLPINVDNCKALLNPAAGGWTGVTNKIRVVYTERASDYQDGSITAQSQANAVGQDGQVREEVLNFPGICTRELAEDVAGRELAARSRPMFKCSAIVDRSFLRTVPGDVVVLTWPHWHISGMLMRVAGVTRGSLENGAIQLDLIQDFFYQRRGLLVDGGLLGALGSFPSEVGP